MTHSSLKEMLQKSLMERIWPIYGGETKPGNAQAQTFRRGEGIQGWQAIPLHLRRQLNPIEYISALPLQLAAQMNIPPEQVMVALGVQTGKGNASLIGEGPIALGSWQDARLGDLTIGLHPSGQMLFALSAMGILGWIKSLGHEFADPPLPAATQWLPGEVPQDQRDLGRSLHLSSLALVQYVHAQCATRCELGWSEPPGLGDREAPLGSSGHPEALDLIKKPYLSVPSPVGSIESLQTPEIQAVIWALVHLVDGLGEAAIKLSDLFQRGYRLGEVTYVWLGTIRLGQTTESVTRDILWAVRGTLKQLLEGRLGHPAPQQL